MTRNKPYEAIGRTYNVGADQCVCPNGGLGASGEHVSDEHVSGVLGEHVSGVLGEHMGSPYRCFTREWAYRAGMGEHMGMDVSHGCAPM